MGVGAGGARDVCRAAGVPLGADGWVGTQHPPHCERSREFAHPKPEETGMHVAYPFVDSFHVQ